MLRFYQKHISSLPVISYSKKISTQIGEPLQNSNTWSKVLKHHQILVLP